MPTKRERYRRETLLATVPEDQGEPSPVETFTSAVWLDADQAGDVPNYRYKISNHIDATSTVGASRVKIESTDGYEDVEIRNKIGLTYVRSIHRIRGEMVGSPTLAYPGTLLTDKANNAAIMDFNKRAYNKVTSLNAGIVVGELRETLQLIRNPLKSLRDSIDSYHRATRRQFTRRRRKRRKRQAIKEAIRDSWLTYAYGVKPLVSDVKGGCEALAKYQHGTLDIENVSSQANESELISDSTSITTVGAVKRHIRRVVIDNCQVKFRGQVRAASNGRPSTPALLGVRWSDVPLIAWELTPYSFLVDYFTNVGDILTSWATGAIDFAWKNRSEKYTRERVTSTSYPNKVQVVHPDTLTKELYGSCKVRSVNTRFTRSSVPGIMIPTFQWEIPGYKSTKWLNIAALADAHVNPNLLF